MTLQNWREAHPDYMKEWHEKHPGYIENWNASHSTYSRDRSRNIRKSVEYERECVVCGQPFKTWIPHKWTCSEKCTISHNSKRIPVDQIIDTDITLQGLFNRDGGICYLCGGKCDWSDKDSDTDSVGRRYPTIDHVVPVKRGGLHSWSNIKLAHMGCNSAKGEKLLEEIIRHD